MMNILDHLEGYFSQNLKIAKTFITLVKFEIRLAGLSIYPLVLNICMLFVILLSAWISMVVLIGYYLVSLMGFVGAISSIVLMNLFLLFILLRYLSFNLRNMSFENTRNFLSKKECEHELTKATETRDTFGKKRINKPKDSATNA